MTATALSDFLLARIAEDEVGYRQMHPTLRVAGQRVTEGRTTTSTEVTLRREKLLAECEAKRLQVAHVRALFDVGYEWADYAEMSLSLLTLPYADHPDWREEWQRW